MRYAKGLTAAAALLMLGAAAQANEQGSFGEDMKAKDGANVGIGVICNTSEQAEQLVSLRAAGQELMPAVSSVNAKAQQPRACGVAAVAFVPDKTLDTKTVAGKVMKIVRIQVVAGYDGKSWHRVDSMVQYAIVESEGIAI
jgi:hypothetical protein